MADYDVIVIGAGPGGIFSAYELVKANRGLKVAVFELGRSPIWRVWGQSLRTHVRRKMEKFHYIGGVLSLAGVIYSA
mgnify:CR=1 FL=1